MTALGVAAASCAALAAFWWSPSPVRRGPLVRVRQVARWTSMSDMVRHRPRSSASQAREVAALCSALASELRSGQPPDAAWAAVLADWSGPLPGRHVDSTDVVTLLTRWARVRGWGVLAAVAACWRVADTTGAGLADALDRLAEAMRHEHEVAAEVNGQLASVRATAAVLATLPAVALAMGHVLGADPLAALVGSAIGLGCLGLGALLAACGWWWLVRQVEAVREGLRW
ncbi:MAG: type II secretion system F family protein [Actinomycetes bacterium]